MADQGRPDDLTPTGDDALGGQAGAVSGDALLRSGEERPFEHHEPFVMTRSEEELVFDTRGVQRERVRLVKRIVTESVTTTTEVRREELHVERVPIAEGADSGPAPVPAGELGATGEAGEAGAESSRNRLADKVRERVAPLQRRVQSVTATKLGRPFEDDELEIELYEEQVVVSKRVVPRERVRLRKHVVTSQQEVHESLRKEEIALEESVPEDATRPQIS